MGASLGPDLRRSASSYRQPTLSNPQPHLASCTSGILPRLGSALALGRTWALVSSQMGRANLVSLYPDPSSISTCWVLIVFECAWLSRVYHPTGSQQSSFYKWSKHRTVHTPTQPKRSTMRMPRCTLGGAHQGDLPATSRPRFHWQKLPIHPI